MKEIELIEKRRPREKHFLQKNGEIIAKIYSDDIHYLKNGKYEEIDNTLIDAGEYLTNNKNAYKVKFSKKTENKILNIESNGNYLDIMLKNERKVILKHESQFNKFAEKVKYDDILDNIDLEYKILPTKVKEAVIIKSRSNIPSKLEFVVKTNLELQINDNKSISALKNGIKHFTIDAPYMVDACGNNNYNIFYELTEKENGYNLNLILDNDWLNNSNTILPIIVDPTITNYSGEDSLQDTYIYPGDSGIDKNSQDILKAGVEKVNGVDTPNRTLIRFELPEIGTGSQIVDAKLWLVGYHLDESYSEQEIMEIRRITESWDEKNADWNKMNDKFDHNRIDGSFYAVRSRVFDGIISPHQTFVDLTDLVKRWYTDVPNFGIMIKPNDEDYKSNKIPAFYSKNNSFEHFNPKPIIQISYRNQNGLESYMQYIAQKYKCGKSFINIYNGNLTTLFNVGSTIGGKLPVDLNIIYNTNDVILNSDFGYGKGLKLNYHQIIQKIDIANTTYLEYIDEDSTVHYFTSEKESLDNLGNLIITKEKETYYDEDGLDLSILADSDYYILTSKCGNIMKFKKNGNVGYLSEIIDTSNNKILIDYNNDNQIIKITDADLSEINIVYDTNLITVLSSNSITTLNYSEGKLISLNNFLGNIEFTYESNNIINMIKDVTNKKIGFSYYEQSPYKIKDVSEYGINNTIGGKLQFKYKFDSTTIIDNSGKVVTYTFNKYGNVASATNLINNKSLKNAYGKSVCYGDFYQQKNKLLIDELPIKYVKNYLKNTSFEEDTNYFNADSGLSISVSEDYALSGQKSMKLINVEAGLKAYEIISVPKGEKYTFSANVKSNNNLKIALSYINEFGQNIENESELIRSNDDFYRYDVSIDYPLTAISELTIKIYLVTTGVAYVDDIQLEIGEVSNNYNYIDSSIFSEELSSWGVEGDQLNYQVVTLDDNTNALKIQMQPKNATSLKKHFNISGNAGDMYNISFWYKNCGLYADGEDVGATIYNNVSIKFEYDDEYGSGIPLSKSLVPNQDEWQFFTCNFIADRPYVGIELRFFQIMNANNLYISNISLYKDIKSRQFNYDENGNIINLKYTNDNEENFGYNNSNQLIKITSSNDKDIIFEYDNVNSDKKINSISPSGITNGIKYNDVGRPNVTKMKYIGSFEEAINGLYKIRLKGTKKYLKNNSLLLTNDECSHSIWKINKVDEFYKIESTIVPNKFLTNLNNSLVLLDFNNDYSLFCLEKNDDNSYCIKCKSNDLYVKNNDNILTLSDYLNKDDNCEFYFERTDFNKFMENNAFYDNDGKFLSSINDTLFNKTDYITDPKTGLVTSLINAKGQKIDYIYNNKHQLASLSRGEKTINIDYENDIISKLVQGDKEYNFIYDEFLNFKSVKMKNKIVLINNDYDNDGKLKLSKYGNNNNIKFEYDNFDRLKTLIKMNNTYYYKYDSNGFLAKIISNDITTKIARDLSKRVTEYKLNNFKINYKYDINSNVNEKKYTLDNIIYTINNQYDLDNVKFKIIFDNIHIRYFYDALGRITTKDINKLFDINYSYMENGNRTSSLIKSIESSGNKYSYKYDKLNNITHIYYNGKLKNKYYYNDYNELIREDNFKRNITIRYKYDLYGNILSKKIFEINTYNLKTNFKYEYNNVDWLDQLSKFNDVLITYDEIGNPISIGDNITLNWINGRELIRYIDNTNTIDYNYDNDGMRTSKKINNIQTKYYNEGNNIIFEKTNDNIIYYIRDEVDGLIGFKYNEAPYYYEKNIQNDIIGIYDSKYNLVARYEYDSFGNNILIEDGFGNDVSEKENHIANINPFRYRSYYFDKETKLYYLKNRYYNPVWGRFINIDKYISTGNSTNFCNMYCYCENNFINECDSAGFFGEWVKKRFNEMKQKVIIKYNNTKIFTKFLGNEIKNFADDVIHKGRFVISAGQGNGLALDGGISDSSIGIKLDYKTHNTTLYGDGEKVCSVTDTDGISFYLFDFSKTDTTILNCETNEVIEKVPGKLDFSLIGSGKYISASGTKEGMFFGFDGSLALFAGGTIKIGWEVDMTKKEEE